MARSMLERKVCAYGGGACRGRASAVSSHRSRLVWFSKGHDVTEMEASPVIGHREILLIIAWTCLLYSSSSTYDNFDASWDQGWQDERNPLRPLAAQPQKLTGGGEGTTGGLIGAMRVHPIHGWAGLRGACYSDHHTKR